MIEGRLYRWEGREQELLLRCSRRPDETLCLRRTFYGTYSAAIYCEEFSKIVSTDCDPDDLNDLARFCANSWPSLSRRNFELVINDFAADRPSSVWSSSNIALPYPIAVKECNRSNYVLTNAASSFTLRINPPHVRHTWGIGISYYLSRGSDAQLYSAPHLDAAVDFVGDLWAEYYGSLEVEFYLPSLRAHLSAVERQVAYDYESWVQNSYEHRWAGLCQS